MKKVFSNKIFAYVLIAILIALHFAQTVLNWVNGNFNGGTLTLFILMLGLLIMLLVGIIENRNTVMLVAGAAIISVLIYIQIVDYSGVIKEWQDGILDDTALASRVISSTAVVLLIGCLLLAILRAFKVKKHIRTINTVFALVAFVLMLVSTIMAIKNGSNDDHVNTIDKVFACVRDLFATFTILLTACVGHQIQSREVQ